MRVDHENAGTTYPTIAAIGWSIFLLGDMESFFWDKALTADIGKWHRQLWLLMISLKSCVARYCHQLDVGSE